MEREDSWDEADWRRRPRQRFERYGRDSLRMRKSPRSGAVTSVAVLNFIAGPLMIIFAMCAGIWYLLEEEGFLGVPGQKPSNLVLTALGLMIFGWALGCIVAGVGLGFRAGWARMFALILGGFAALAGIVSGAIVILIWAGARGNAPGGNGVYLFRSVAQTVFFLGYCLWTYAVLLNPRFLADFR